MEITELRTSVVDAGPNRTWLFVELLTNEGLTGTGEASQSHLDAGVIAQTSELASLYIGKDPLDLIERNLAGIRQPAAHRILYAAISAIDQALWDICGQALGVPVFELLGGSIRRRIDLYANVSLASDDGSPLAYAASAERAVISGFRAVKVNAFDRTPTHEARYLGAGWNDVAELAVARVRAVREAVGPDIEIMTDWSFALHRPSDALAVADRIAEFNVFWIEDPLASSDPHLLAELRRRAPSRVATGEQLSGRRSFRPLLEANSADVLMPDVKWIGGLSEARKLASMAEVYDVEISPHNMSGPVATAASVHLAACLPNFLVLEWCWGGPAWRADLVDGGERIVDGAIEVPIAPGLGVRLDPKVVEGNRV